MLSNDRGAKYTVNNGRDASYQAWYLSRPQALFGGHISRGMHLSMKHEDILQVLVIDGQQGEMGTYQAWTHASIAR